MSKLQQWKKEESERLGGEGDQIKFIDLRFARRQAIGTRKARFQTVHVLGMNDYLWDRISGLGTETWKGCE